MRNSRSFAKSCRCFEGIRRGTGPTEKKVPRVIAQLHLQAPGSAGTEEV